MLILRSYRTEIDPTPEQVTACLKHAGVARYAYNWGISRQKQVYEETRKRLTLNELKKAWVREGPEWRAEVSYSCCQSAFFDLERAFQNFFRRVKAGQKPGFPRFKSRKYGVGGFRLYGSIRIRGRYLQAPRIGTLRLKESGYFPEDGVKVLNLSIHEQAGRWYACLQVEMEIPDPPARSEPVIGVDLGISTLATCSDGETYANPKAMAHSERKIKRLQRAVSRKQKGSANRRKAVRKLARAHARVSDLRREAIHQATNAITKRAGTVVIEDLNVAGMLKNSRLAKAIGDAGFREFRRQIEYKMRWRGGQVVVADRWLPSSKTCSACGCLKQDLKLSDRLYRCDHCGLRLDRDLNAALNLKAVAARSAETLNALPRGEVQEATPVLPVEMGTHVEVRATAFAP